jgi:hypothetical protein
MARTLSKITILTVVLFSTAALAFEVRSYNEDSKTYHGTFNCHGTKNQAGLGRRRCRRTPTVRAR